MISYILCFNNLINSSRVTEGPGPVKSGNQSEYMVLIPAVLTGR